VDTSKQQRTRQRALDARTQPRAPVDQSADERAAASARAEIVELLASAVFQIVIERRAPASPVAPNRISRSPLSVDSGPGSGEGGLPC
jgi:hypothetical protein